MENIHTLPTFLPAYFITYRHAASIDVQEGTAAIKCVKYITSFNPFNQTKYLVFSPLTLKMHWNQSMHSQPELLNPPYIYTNPVTLVQGWVLDQIVNNIITYFTEDTYSIEFNP